MSVDHSLVPVTRSKDYQSCLKEVCSAATKSLYTLKDEYTGDVYENAMCFSQAQRYVGDDDTHLNVATLFGDIMGAINVLSNKIDNFDTRLTKLEKACSAVGKIDGLGSDVLNMIDHMRTLENNLRCIRETFVINEEECPVKK
jgi:hypothetical protein